MAELERLANHFGDIGAICNDAGFALMLAHCGVLRERVLRTAQACFGHRLMMDCIVPGGVSIDLPSPGFEQIRELVRTIGKAFPPLVELYDNTASLQDRTVGTGLARPALVKQYGCGGSIGRASARAFDARVQLSYPPYEALLFNYDVPVLADGDVNARIWIRIREVEQSLALVEQILARMPVHGAIRVPVTGTGKAGEGLALVEGFRGDILAWVRLDAEARVERCHLRDPSWFQWPVLEAAIENNIVADFPLCNKSFNCSYSGTIFRPCLARDRPCFFKEFMHKALTPCARFCSRAWLEGHSRSRRPGSTTRKSPSSPRSRFRRARKTRTRSLHPRDRCRLLQRL